MGVFEVGSVLFGPILGVGGVRRSKNGVLGVGNPVLRPFVRSSLPSLTDFTRGGPLEQFSPSHRCPIFVFSALKKSDCGDPVASHRFRGLSRGDWEMATVGASPPMGPTVGC